MRTGRFPLFWLSLRRRRRMLAFLAVGIAVFETLIVVIARTVPPTQLFAGGANPPGAFKAFSGSTGDVTIASYPGLLGAGLVHPFWIAMMLTAIGSLAAAAVAADVESGTIELLMVRPVTRIRLLAERTAALLAVVVLLNAAATLAMAAGIALSPTLHQAVSLRGVFAAGLMGIGFTVCLTGPALAVSAAGRRRAQVIGATIAFGAVGFAVNFVAMAWSRAAPLRFLSPFHYYAPGDALAHGTLAWGSLAVLLAVGVAGIGAAVPLLARRDLAP
ncbi:ABC transporter permease subunit [Streptomyces sp. H10-C2]|uniref:ABC transporter permease subunit n=1 Tax=unclassified Streptomyces TaxID=2593676 RepID=UPI0024BA3D10|nr:MULTISPECIES: ABC transporter permease subunit [unclassified Streptomyces]MDJ0344749.1 ABC transporter permease subunit [Streptomyces sp. PH10-H1]MDJ0371240.1 ABC transporter permease subunit [Streptomyces sp. H10-C2]